MTQPEDTVITDIVTGERRTIRDGTFRATPVVTIADSDLWDLQPGLGWDVLVIEEAKVLGTDIERAVFEAISPVGDLEGRLVVAFRVISGDERAPWTLLNSPALRSVMSAAPRT